MIRQNITCTQTLTTHDIQLVSSKKTKTKQKLMSNIIQKKQSQNP